MNKYLKQLKAKLEDEQQALGTTVGVWKKTNGKKFSKKIKISPFLLFGVTGAVVVFLVFSLVLMPILANKSSNSGTPEILRVVTGENHFNKAEAQAQFNSRNITLATTGGDTTGTPTGNTGTGVVVPPFKPAVRPNPFN